MDLQDCTKFATDHHICIMSTLDGDQPRARPVGMWFADNTGFYFQCGTYKPYHTQLRNHDKVEAIFFNDSALHNLHGKDIEPIRTMRVTGKIEFLDDDLELRAKCIEAYPVYKRIGVTKPEDLHFAVFRIYTGEISFWTAESIQKEKNLPKIKF